MTACKSNLKNCATALEMYASDNEGHYCSDPTLLIRGNYLKLIPTCPGANKDSYSQSYTCQASPDNFTLYCKGDNHGKAYPAYDSAKRENFPQYNSTEGLIDHP